MPSKRAAGALQDIRSQIELAQSFVQGMTFEQFHNDRRTVYAVIRCLEIISEASRRLPGELKDRHPQVPWADMAGAGNVYRHDYEDVADDMVWQTVQDSLGRLLTVVDDELQRS
jgi:uncharacterized protein with HEPN domain